MVLAASKAIMFTRNLRSKIYIIHITNYLVLTLCFNMQYTNSFWLLYGTLIWIYANLCAPSQQSVITEQHMAEQLQNLYELKHQNQRLLALVKNISSENDNAKRVNCSGTYDIDVRQRLQTLPRNDQKQRTGSLDESFGISNRQRENNRRTVENGMRWYYIRTQFESIATRYPNNTQLRALMDQLKDVTFQHHAILMYDLSRLRAADGDEKKRRAELDELSAIIQKRLDYIQNPANCTGVKKASCSLLHKHCGFGSMIHHLLNCVTVAYATRRAIVLDSNAWFSSHQGWETAFLPLSSTCKTEKGDNITQWAAPEVIAEAEIVSVPPSSIDNPTTDYLPRTVPEDIAHKMIRLHGFPFIWWYGQLLKYLLRPNPTLTEIYRKVEAKLDFASPIVGVHVRRSDKVTSGEAEFFTIDEYMVHVEEYYKVLSYRQTVDVKRVYLATDAKGLLEKAQRRYPDYVFITGNSGTAQFTETQDDRSSADAIWSIILDLYFLSKSDYLVCTFSSNVCRLTYEMMQAEKTDASNWWYSLDTGYMGDWVLVHDHRVLYENTVSRKPEIVVGDILHCKRQRRLDAVLSGRSDRFPGVPLPYDMYKVEEVTSIAKFTPYEDVDSLMETY